MTGEEGVIGSAWSQWQNRLEIEREYTLTPKVQKLNQKVHCRARGRHVACSSRAIATRRRRHTVKKPFCSAADTVDLSVPQPQGCARRQKKFQQSRESHERFAELRLDIVHNQAHRQTGVPLWHHYDILNKLYSLWHYSDTIITLTTFTKVRLLWHIMTKAGKILLSDLWHNFYCHYDILNIMTLMCIITPLSPLSHFELLWHLWHWETIIAYYDNYKTLCAFLPSWHYYIHYCILIYYYTYDIKVQLLAIMTIAKHNVH